MYTTGVDTEQRLLINVKFSTNSFVTSFSDASSYDCNIDANIEPIKDYDMSPSKVFNFIRKIKPNKAPGPDGISGHVLKYCARPLCYPLSIIFNMSFRTGILPRDWKYL